MACASDADVQQIFGHLHMVKMVIRWSHLERLHFTPRVGRCGNAQTPTRRYISVQDSLYAQTHTTPGVINFGLGQPSKSLLPLELFQQAAAHRFQPSQDAALLQYGAGKGYLGFRKALAGFLSDAYDRDVDADALMVTAGNSQAISHAAIVLSQDTRRRAFVEQPTYFLAFDIFRELGLSLESLRVDHDGLDVDALEQKLRAGDVPSFLYTIPFYHNPTGAVLPADRCKRLIELARQFDFSIISDEPYNVLGFTGKNHRSLASYDSTGRVLSLGSFSKILAPGLRLGWAHSQPSTIEKLAALGPIRSGGGQNPLTASLVHSLLDQGSLAPHIASLQTTFGRRRGVMCESLRALCPDCKFREPEGGYFVWVKLPSGVDAHDLYDEATSRHGVAFTPGSRCALPSSDVGEPVASSSEHIRLSFAFYDDADIREGIKRLADALNNVQAA